MSEKISSITEFATGLSESDVDILQTSLQTSLGRSLDTVMPAVSRLRQSLVG